MSEWRDIASAPKDGTEILVFGPMLNADKKSPRDCMSVAYFKAFKDGTSLWCVGTTSAGFLTAMNPLTHWMPLPSPPEDK